MAKSKKRPMKTDAKPEAKMTAASAHAHMEAASAFAEEPETEVKEKAVPAVEKDEEKEMLLGLVKRLMDDMGATSLSDLSAMIDKAEERKLMHAHGLSEEAAKLFLSQQEKVRTLRAAKAAAAREAVYAGMRLDPLYDDVDARKEAVEALILRTGLSPKEAYLALFAEERLKKLQKEMDEKETAADKKAKKIPALSGGDAPDAQRSMQLSEAENRMAKKAGMTPEEYAKYKYAY